MFITIKQLFVFSEFCFHYCFFYYKGISIKYGGNTTRKHQLGYILSYKWNVALHYVY